MLVHCVEGVSRSCGVVMGWMLADDRSLDCPAARSAPCAGGGRPSPPPGWRRRSACSKRRTGLRVPPPAAAGRAADGRGQAHPNAGFRKQLKLWCTMGARIDPDHPGYRMHRLQSAAMLYDGRANAAVSASALSLIYPPSIFIHYWRPSILAEQHGRRSCLWPPIPRWVRARPRRRA